MKKLLYLFILLMTGYLNLVYEWPEGVTVLLVELLFPVILYLQAKFAMARVRVAPKEGLQIAQEGEEIQIPFIVENIGKTTLSSVWVKAEHKRYLIRKLKKGEKCTVFVSFRAGFCEKKKIEIRKMWIADAADMMKIRVMRLETVPAEIRVIPKKYPVFVQISRPVRLFVAEGEEYSKDRGGDDSSEVFDVHEYMPGDKIAQIHWKLSARTGELYMKEFSFPLGAAVVLLLDRKADGKTDKKGTAFFNLVASTGWAIMEESCRFYAVWREKESQMIRRFLVKDEETFYDWMLELSSMEMENFDELDETVYRYEFFEPYKKAVVIGADLTIQCGEEETLIFHTGSLEQELSETVLEI